MEALRNRRDVLFERMKWEHKNGRDVVEKRNPTPSEVQERLQKLLDLSDNFDKVQSELEEFTPGIGEITTIFNHRIEFDNLYYETKNLYLSFLDNVTIRGDSDAASVEPRDDLREAIRLLVDSQRFLANTQAAASTSLQQLAGQLQSVTTLRPLAAPVPGNELPLEVKLPTFSLPIFYGDRKQWNSFKDLYVSCVHSKNIKDSVKLQYLLSHLDGEAKKLVGAFSITDANYVEVWDKLNEHYDKKKFIVTALVKEFVEQPSVSAPSLVGLRKLVSTADEVIRQLKALGPEYESRDPWLIHLLLDKLDRETRSMWAQKVVDLDNPTFRDFLAFLERRCDAMETYVSFARKGNDGTVRKELERRGEQIAKPAQSNKVVQSFHASTQLSCPMCSQAHTIYQCVSFKEMVVGDRRVFVQRTKLCYNCLKASHISRDCTSMIVCKQCKQRHHTLLCPVNTSNVDVQDSAQRIESPATSEHEEDPAAKLETEDSVASYVTNLETCRSTDFVSMLPTAVVKVLGKDNVFHELRAIIDSACMASMITKQAFQRLGLKRRNANVLVSGINPDKHSKAEGAVTLQISSRFDETIVVVVDALILNHLVSDQPCQRFSVDTSALSEAPLADPQYNDRGKIDLLLGVEVFFSILEAGKLVDNRGVSLAQNSVFGYLVGGRFDASPQPAHKNAVINLVTEVNLDRTLRKFWEVEEIPNTNTLTEDERRAVDHFNTSVSRSADGRYVVRLPFDDTKPELGESATTAIRRFHAMERKFSLDPILKQLYTKFMTDYLMLGHMQKIPPTEVPVPANKCFYLPHHAVWKEDSSTTKLRVVFDASCKSASGVSLNDRLLIGPNMNEPLVNVYCRWRTYRVAFTADAEKMYRQLWISSEDTDFLRVVWRSDPGEPLEHYRLLTVTYGTACAAYQAMAGLRKVAEDNKEEFPRAAERIPKNFYVDDLLSGADTVEEAMQLKDEINDVLASVGLNLRKWSSTDRRLLEPGASEEIFSVKLPQEEATVKALGIHWIPKDDIFFFKVSFDMNSVNTKRQLLSDSSKLFDPFGWLAPVIVRSKILFQHLWLYDLQWDDPLPACICDEWIEMKETLHHVESIRINRWIPHHGGELQLHGFADASEAAYAAVVYSRSVNEDGDVCVNIVAAKTKVAPIQQVSLPRLELLAAELLVDLMTRLMDSFTDLKVELFAWTDSSIVLHWLSSHPRRWKTFVANRTAKILNFLPRNQWHHVASTNNPADCASRGVSPIELVDHPLWWTGPSWLKETTETWVSSHADELERDEELMEGRANVTCLSINVEAIRCYDIENYLLIRYSDLNRIRRILCWINRFAKNMKSKLCNAQDVKGPLTPKEIDDACQQLARAAQHDAFRSELELLQRNSTLPNNSKIKTLYPFLDSNGTLRVGGRLQNSVQPYDMRHPVILPKIHRYTQLLLSEIHLRNLHAGPTLMIATLNQRYWIVGCQAVVRALVDSCVRCCRLKGKTSTQLMGTLPSVRSMPTRPFSHTGVDYAGPVLIRTSNLRTAKTTKGYVAVFVCLSTKAVHLEPVTDLSTNAFMAALKRFTSRRGLCHHIWSDHGTNFVGADREIRRYLQSDEFNEAVSRYLGNLKINWTFITPSAPHMGGIWEAAVKSMKKHLRAVVGNVTLTFEELGTVLSQVEACLNSRPLCQLSPSTDSCEALTPGHFIIGQPLNLLPQPDVSHVPENRLDRWQRIQKYTTSIWDRWRDEYVATLQPRNKWHAVQQNLRSGQLVLIKNENSPPATWDLARVVDTHPDRFGIVRTVTLRRGQLEYQRPVQKLVLLPCD